MSVAIDIASDLDILLLCIGQSGGPFAIPSSGSRRVQKKRKKGKPNMKAVKPHIERMLGFTGYKVKLSCGHSFECSAEDADRDRLFIGKSVQCEKCLDRETGAPDGRDASGRIGTEVK